MKRFLLLASLLFSLGIVNLSFQSTDDDWSPHKAKKWFKKKEWLNGLAVTPHSSIDKVQFAKQYHSNKKYWDEAFAFLKNTNLATLSTGRHTIDSDNVYATMAQGHTKDFDSTAFESHRKYIDLHYLVTGEEKMGKAPITSLTVNKPYNATTDLAYYTGDGKYYTIPAGTFILFFPTDAHRPNIKADENKAVKKIVIKIRVADANN